MRAGDYEPPRHAGRRHMFMRLEPRWQMGRQRRRRRGCQGVCAVKHARSETFFEQRQQRHRSPGGGVSILQCVYYFSFWSVEKDETGEGRVYCSTHRYTQHATTSTVSYMCIGMMTVSYMSEYI